MRRSKLSKHKQSRLIEHFVGGATARCAASLVGVNKTTAAYYFHRLREIIAYHLELESHEYFDGEIEVDHSKLFADKGNHINGIENFWNQGKRHMRKFNGIPRSNFGLYLKECEWRFNNPDPKEQLKQIKQWVKGILT